MPCSFVVSGKVLRWNSLWERAWRELSFFLFYFLLREVLAAVM